jgi:high-affinity nickel permease
MAVIRREVSDRTTFGNLMKWIFIGFNILMIVWVIAGFSAASDSMQNTVNEAEQAGAAIGTTIGMGMLMIFWVLGDIILGMFVLFTRRKKIIETEE